MRTTALFALTVPVLALSLASCGSGQTAGEPAGEPVYEEGAIIHQVTQADKDASRSKEPLTGTSATLWVNGLGCPQCASNMDMQMKRIKSVTSVRTDLGNGMVYLTLSGKGNPSPHTLSERTLDAGFTLVKVEHN